MKRYLVGFVTGFALAVTACGGGYVYKYYGLDVPAECYDKGKLLGKQGTDGWADENFSECKPDDQVKGKCWILKSSEFFKAIAEIEYLRKALVDCQKNCPKGG